MRKILSGCLLFLFFHGAAQTNSRLLDQPMELRKLSVKVTSNSITATTFLEMEFYNSHDVEEEGVLRFELKPGQVITGFQLELNGQFRDGSIETSAKAQNVYNTVVGKRVDPALLAMESANHYRLNVYPIAAKSTRRVNITIQQILDIKNDCAVYFFPFGFNDILQEFKLDIKVASEGRYPLSETGMIGNKLFRYENDLYTLHTDAKDIKANQPIAFRIPIPAGATACKKTAGDSAHIAIRFKPGIPGEYQIQAESLTVFWDISASGKARMIDREIEFLRTYFTTYHVPELRIITFNHALQDTMDFMMADRSFSHWMDYLRSLHYSGGTQLGILDFSKINSDLIMVFTDGRNSFGRKLPVAGNRPVFTVHANYYADANTVQLIIGNSGGSDIDLLYQTAPDYIQRIGKARNSVLSCEVKGVAIQGFNIMQEEGYCLFNGMIPRDVRELKIVFGNAKKQIQQMIHFGAGLLCDESPIERIPLLATFEILNKNNQWWNYANLAMEEKIVTVGTSFIVLEKIEDYVKLNIKPPKDLESQCDMQQFVKKQTAKPIYLTIDEDLSGLMSAYNKKINWWNEGALKPYASIHKDFKSPFTGIAYGDINFNGEVVYGDWMPMQEEVVVTSLGVTRQRKELGYSVTNVRADDFRDKYYDIQQALAGRVAGVNIQSVYGNTNEAFLRIRGVRSVANSTPLYVVDGVPYSPDQIGTVNVNDILNVDILKGNSAAAIYGYQGQNGVVVITTKKGKQLNSGYYENKTYYLEDRPEVEYMQEFRNAAADKKLSVFRLLEKGHKNEPGFYFDMCQLLFESGYKNQAMDILYSIPDFTGRSKQVLKTMGYILDAWKQFDEAIDIWWELIESDSRDLFAYRDLSISLYQQGKYQQAVEALNEGINIYGIDKTGSTWNIRSGMLQEMNAIISAHKDQLDISMIDPGWIRSLPVDIRITADDNFGLLAQNISIQEPGGATCSLRKPNTKNGGMMTTESWLSVFYGGTKEYQVKSAKPGRYRIWMEYYDTYRGNAVGRIPEMVRVIVFKNFGTTAQTLEIKNVIMDNQSGQVEIARTEW